MKKCLNLLLPIILLFISVCLAFGLARLYHVHSAAPQTPPAVAPQIMAVALKKILVHGETAQISAENSAISLSGDDGSIRHRFFPAESEYANHGLKLYQLPAAVYRVYSGELPVLAGDIPLPEGYTLPRDGVRKHWQFAADGNGYLLLTVRDTDKLPDDVYDVFIDVGHGGQDSGAVAFGYVEAEQNLRAALYMRERLAEMGIKAQLSREGDEISGGEMAENNPYLSGARLDSVYRSGAKYLLSNHLNAGGGNERGFQIYSSVRTDSAFAAAVAEKLREAGHRENNNGIGLMENGVYKRRSEVFSTVPRDYYFIIRESGGYALSPYRYRLQNSDMASELVVGAESLLLEYAFIDHRGDLEYWLANYRELVDAVLAGAAEYWQL